MRLTRSLRDQAGFTLVELLVGMVLSMLVLAMVIGFVINVFGSSDRTAARTKAQRAAVLAHEQLTSDLRSMRAPQREPIYTGSPDRLRSMLLTGYNPQRLQVHDLLVATPTRTTFFAEVASNPAGPECVTWEVMGTGALHRTVRRATNNCVGGGGAVLQQREVMPAPPATGTSASARAPAPFSYGRLVQPRPAAAVINPDACTTPVSTTLTTNLARDQVTSIRLDLRTFVVNRNASGDQQLQSTVAIASRQGSDFRYGIGCAA